MQSDTIVLGAGMVGVSIALHLQKRGRRVALVDRRGVAEETSYGNTGIIQREANEPYMFPRGEWRKMLDYALNRTSEANLHYSALPRILIPMLRFYMASTPERTAATGRAIVALARHCVSEHETLAREASAMALLRPTGYLVVHRNPADLEKDVQKRDRLMREYGVPSEPLDAAGVRRLEPHLHGSPAGGLHITEPVSVADPGGLGKAYGDLFVGLGGKLLRGEARTLKRTPTGGWQVETAEGPLTSNEVVVALGPWADVVLGPLGLRLPLFVKRGYHMHYRATGNATLGRPVIDAAYGYALAPLMRGIRLTTGAEFALRDAPPTPRQLAKVEPRARELFPLADRTEPEPWLGRRPCLPDMLPIIGPAVGHPGLWLAIGHQHWGFTLGPVTGRLLAEMMSGQTPLTDPAPYRANRF